MSAAGPEGRSLIEAGRKAFRPTSEDRKRIFDALQTRIAAGSGSAGGLQAAAPAAKTAGWLGVSAAAVVGLGVVAALLLPASKTDTAEVAASASVAPRAVPTLEPTAPIAATENETPAEKVPAPSLPVVPAARASTTRRSDRLAEEVAILSRAESERHGGRFASALGVLDEHRRKFPRGALTQERMAARVRVLCSLGRVAEAEAEFAVLKRASPQSVHLQARAACTAK